MSMGVLSYTFFKEGGRMKHILTGQQMKAADRFTIEQIGIPSLVLMERAALKVVECLENETIDLRKILVVCGPGNNGGDGYAVARLLHLKGYDVSVYYVGNPQKRSEENRTQKEIVDYYQIPHVQDLQKEEYSVIIDAIFGVGLTREITGDFYDVIEIINKKSGKKVAVDLPSGIHDETGSIMGIAFRADLTVAIAYSKRGHFLRSGHEYTGKLVIADIGIYDDALPEDGDFAYYLEINDLKQGYPKRSVNAHKGDCGRVLLVVGSKGMSGAAYLCGKAAYAAGAGLVQIYTHEANRIILQQLLPEAIVTTYTEYDKEQVTKLLRWADVIGIGCGLGKSECVIHLVRQVFEEATCPCIADADALNLMAEDMSILSKRKCPVIITPHMKEMARICNCDMKILKEQREAYLNQLTNEYQVICVCKDARTLVAEKGKALYINTAGNEAMAKAGSGDVLTGIITGIAAQKVALYDAACLGTFLHGLAGDMARNEKGTYSVMASDLIESIGKVLRG